MRSGANLSVKHDQVPDHELDDFVAFATELADAAHAMLAPAGRWHPEMTVKADRSFVTAFDIEIERRLRAMIADRYPSHGILGEEGQAKDANAEFVWVLDPIDGTAPYIAGAPVYGTLIALAHARIPVIGVIDQAATDDRWIGARGRPTRHSHGTCARGVARRDSVADLRHGVHGLWTSRLRAHGCRARHRLQGP
jgi:fructose-1,6-bisphosphatase/inositol monophosphatase family enzyme